MAFNKMSNKEADRWQRKQDKMFERRHRPAPKKDDTYTYQIAYVDQHGQPVTPEPRVIPEPRMSPYEIEWHQGGVQRRYRIMIDNFDDHRARVRRRNGMPDEVTITTGAMMSSDFYYFVTDEGMVMKVVPYQTGPYSLEITFGSDSILYDQMEHHEPWEYDHEQRCFYDKYWRWKKLHEPEFLEALAEA